jgi:hypothetical protein
LPLTERVCFKTRLQRGNRFQVSKYVRWKYKLETDQTLKVIISVNGVYCNPQVFLSRMSKDGRIVITKVNMSLLQNRKSELAGYVLNVTLEPF